MDIHESIKYAQEYLHQSMFQPDPFENYKLNRNLQYLLCQAFERLKKAFGEVTRHDIAYLIEAWIMSQGVGHERAEALMLRRNPD